ncbi:hypothetical protein [Enterococcus sp.]|uniref:hypothetical protein n=1 Tax=Enterococcus sp. TaxID=35783 RepID=UPI0029068C26|nr:hypothetical protein [Enterococcus sp.]MDU5336124.1 hypothetical protein [Enterococcus sp.]
MALANVKIGQRTLFGVKKENLMKRIRTFFEQTGNAAEVVEYLVAILLRNALCVGDFSLNLVVDLIHQIFLISEPNDTLRQHAIYFQKFFSEEQWQTVIARLFQSETAFREATKETCLYNELLMKRTQIVRENSEEQFKIVSVFMDASGKKHTWTLSNTKEIPKEAEQEIAEVAELLKLMTTLTIFETPAGIRRFTEYMSYKSKRGSIDVEHKAAASQPKVVSSTQASATPSTTKQTQASTTNRSNTPQKVTNPVSNSVNTNNTLSTNADTLLSLPEEAPPTKLKSCSAAPNPTTTETTPAQKSTKKPETIDTSQLRYGKTDEQIKKGREAKKKKKIFDRAFSWRNRKKK